MKTKNKNNWTEKNIPDLTGKIIIVTGATSGLGKEATRVLAKKNATVIMAVRNTKKGEDVKLEILNRYPKSKIEVKELDLSDLNSIKKFSDNILMKFKRLDILINNAGIMMCPYSTTKDGFEIQMGTNHLGHFALTGHLFPLLKKTQHSRIVITSSMAHKWGKIDLTDFNWETRTYKTNQAYGDSKIANLHFMYELINRNKYDPKMPLVTASHPGWTATELQRHAKLADRLNGLFAQKVDMGTLPTLRAAFDKSAKMGDYFGPKGFLEMRGYPIKVKSNKLSRDKKIAKELWKISEKLTNVYY